MDEMDVTSISSPDKIRKTKGDSHHSSKKRKRREDGLVHEDEEKKKKKKKEKHGKHQRGSRHSRSPSPASEDEAGTSPLSARKPFTTSPDATESSSFHLVTSTIYLPLSPISISPTHAVSSLLAEHISPLLLTYYPPVRGIILAYSNPSISSTPPAPAASSKQQHSQIPQPLTLALTANEYGVLYVYLTLTFLVFRPQQSQSLEGWINVQSEDFLGAIVLNLFSVGIERRRLPGNWKWIAPGQQPADTTTTTTTSTSISPTDTPGEDDESEVDSDKENFKPLPSSNGNLDMDSNALELGDESSGYFQTPSGRRVRGTIRFQVRDVDVIPGSERDKGFLSIEGTMLSPEKEAKLVEEERNKLLGPGRVAVHPNARDEPRDVTMPGAAAMDDSGNEGTTSAAATEKRKKKLKKSKA